MRSLCGVSCCGSLLTFLTLPWLSRQQQDWRRHDMGNCRRSMRGVCSAQRVRSWVCRCCGSDPRVPAHAVSLFVCPLVLFADVCAWFR
jgi:hypothetical protein